MQALILGLMVPIMLLNFLGGVIGGIWLFITGDWSTFFAGLAYGLLGVFVLSILLMPGLALAYPMTKLAEGGREKLALLAGLPSLVWTYAVLTISCVWVFSWIMSQADDNPVPYLLWAYSTATAPWVFMAQKDAQAGNEYAGQTTFFAQLGMIAMCIAYLKNQDDLSFERLIWWFAPLMIVALLFSLLIVWANVESAKRYRSFDEL
jgi:hypothetical protein